MASSYSQRQIQYQYRLMSPMGVYPKSTISVDEATLFVDDDLVVLSSTDDLDGVEIYVKASILISNQQLSDNLRFYAFPYLHQLDSEIKSSVDMVTIKSDIQMKRKQHFRSKGGTVPEFDWYENAKGASLPPILGGAPYHWLQTDIDESIIRNLYNRLKQQRCSRLRAALTALVGSNQMSCHFQFHQQAVGLLLDALRLAQEVEGLHLDRAQIKTILSQLGDSADDYLISRQQMAQKVGPIDYHRLFVQTCTQFRKYLLDQ
ncbi:hypothetical protein [Kangiella sediminilitoris]|uniref:Uncharacterized protein n=1 Tax=Kangiella sediminilitoris TaxID=1144748 RepID=A0A1B3BDC2_9GAMM|nr:hypothetical protein [Kangiella sediminilitoris]AOE50834.1 hypothetical protein KS2013_2129 [Kangiella sediminilitoris]